MAVLFGVGDDRVSIDMMPDFIRSLQGRFILLISSGMANNDCGPSKVYGIDQAVRAV